jgi:hypothetical protein
MKALVVRQPWASLIAHGIKTIETRGFAPRTVLQPGDQLAIVAGKVKPSAVHERHWYGIDDPTPAVIEADESPWVWTDWDDQTGGTWRWWSGPLGAVVAVVTFDRALPMEECPPYSSSFDDRWEPEPPSVLYLGGLDGGPWAFIDGDGPIRFVDEAPLGDFTPGRYGWLLSNPHRLTSPVPCPAKRPDGSRTVMQGVFTLPDDVLADVQSQLAAPAL